MVVTGDKIFNAAWVQLMRMQQGCTVQCTNVEYRQQNSGGLFLASQSLSVGFRPKKALLLAQSARRVSAAGGTGMMELGKERRNEGSSEVQKNVRASQ